MKVIIGTCLSGKSTLAEILSKGKEYFDIDSFNSPNDIDMEFSLEDVRKHLEANQYRLDLAVIHGITVTNRLYLLGTLTVPIDILFCKTSIQSAIRRNEFRKHNQIPVDVIRHQFENLQDIDCRFEYYNSVKHIYTK